MTKQPFLVPVIAIAIGVLILLAGLSGVVFYVTYAVESTGEADRSGLFWYLSILLTGLGGVVAGVALLVVGAYAFQGNAACYRLVRAVLMVVPMIALVVIGTVYVGEHLAQRERAARTAQRAEHERVLADMQRIRRINVREQHGGAIGIHVATTGGLAGDYELRLKVETSRGVLFRKTSRLALESSVSDIQRSITYRALFARCFDDTDSGEFFVCVQGAGTANTRFRLQVELVLLGPTGDAGVDIQADPGTFTSRSSVEFFMDTFTRSDGVQVESFKALRES